MSETAGRIALVEDDPIMGESLQRALELEGWRTFWAHSGQEAIDTITLHAPDLVICDLRLPDMGGEDVFRQTNLRTAAPPFIFMTAFGQIAQAVELVRAGAYDYLTKPFDLDTLFRKARTVLATMGHEQGTGVLGVSPAMLRIEALLRRIAPRTLPVLFVGETGSGKEVCARFLHETSPAAGEPFMAVNCAAIPSELMESELFGHERGAFSGAHQRHLGYAERARSGTLFLDEIGSMPTPLQTKLLRVLEERSFSRVGGEARIALRARIVCATCENLLERVQRGLFREDLYYRINAVTVEAPPLRERPEDISWLMSRFFQQFSAQADVEMRGVSSLVEEIALTHPWRGNARELRNRMERAVSLASGPWLMPRDLFPESCGPSIDQIEPDVPLAAVRDAAESRQIQKVLRETRGQIGEAAKRLGVSRTTLWEKMRRYALAIDGLAK